MISDPSGYTVARGQPRAENGDRGCGTLRQCAMARKENLIKAGLTLAKFKMAIHYAQANDWNLSAKMGTHYLYGNGGSVDISDEYQNLLLA